MDNFLLWLTGLIVGIVATILVTKHYYRRTVRKELTPFIQSYTSVFEGVDPTVRDSLQIVYRGTTINDLCEIQFLIANTGERSIMNSIKPLELEIPEEASLLDASILHVHPEGRDVSIQVRDSRVTFEFPILNSKEFFITKILLQGTPDPESFNFAISSDDLPPYLEIRPLMPNLVESPGSAKFEVGIFVFGLAFLLFGLAVFSLSLYHWPIVVDAWSFQFVETVTDWRLRVSAVFSALVAMALGMVGCTLMVAAFTNLPFLRRTRFRIPPDYLRRPAELPRAIPGNRRMNSPK